jgi:hypothetical protein
LGKAGGKKMTETVLMKTGMRALINQLGVVEAERFISILLRQPFDYTEWRKGHLCIGMTVREIIEAAQAYNHEGGKD